MRLYNLTKSWGLKIGMDSPGEALNQKIDIKEQPFES